MLEINKTRINKFGGCVMVPLMMAYMMAPAIYGSDTPASSSSRAKETLIAFPIKARGSETTDALSATAGAASADSSFASNYTLGVGASVNSQTGQIGLNFSNVKVSGISNELDIDLGLSNGGPGKSVFGLPVGWSYNIDYIDLQAGTYGMIHMNGGQTFVIDPNYMGQDGYKSGLRYFPNKSIQFITALDSSATFTPIYAGETSIKINYSYLLKTHTGETEYFDGSGRLVCQSDRFGNLIQYNYELIDPNGVADIYNSQLISIIDSYGQTISISYDLSPKVTVTMPDSRTAIYDFSQMNSGGNITVTDLTGRNVTIKTTNNGTRVTEIDYPTGGKTTYNYSTNIPYQMNGASSAGFFPAVSDMTADPGANGVKSTTTYSYASGSSNTFTGNGSVDYYDPSNPDPTVDALMQSNSNAYTYTTKVTQNPNTQNITTSTTYNFLHLPLETLTANSDSTQSVQTQIAYLGQSQSGNFEAYNSLVSNYNLPATTSTALTNNSGQLKTKVNTQYNDYGQQTFVSTFDDQNSALATKAMTYDPTFGLQTGEISTDLVSNNSKITTNNTLSSDSKSIALSISAKTGFPGESVAQTLDSYGRPLEHALAYAEGGTGETITVTTSYGSIGSNGQMTITLTDAEGNVSSQVVDVRNGWVISKTDANGNTANYTYTNNGLTIKETMPDGSWTITDNSNPNEVLITHSTGETNTTVLDGFGRKISQTNSLEPNMTTNYTYNDQGRIDTENMVYSGAGAFKHTTTYTYDWKGRPLSSTDYLGNTMSTAYDDILKTSTKSYNLINTNISYYDNQGQIISQTDLLNNTLQAAIYNGFGNETSNTLSLSGNNSLGIGVIATNDDNDKVTTLSTYDLDNKVASFNLLTTDGMNATSLWTKDILGNELSRTTTFTGVSQGVDPSRPSLKSEVKTYDKLGRMTSLTNQMGQTQAYTYDKIGNLLTMTDFAGNVTAYTYDNMNRMLTSTTTSGNNTIKIVNTYYPVIDNSILSGKLQKKELYENGSLSDSVAYTYTSRGLLSGVTYMDGKSMNMSYDDLNRVVSSTDYTGSETTFTYDTTILSNIMSATAVYNGLNIGSVAYSYYPVDKTSLLGSGSVLKSESYGNGMTVSYDYYTSSGGTSQQSPKLKSIKTVNSSGDIMSQTMFNYNLKGEVISQTQSSNIDNSVNSNNLKNFTYNDIGDLLGETVYDSSNNLLNTTAYTYDTNNNVLTRVITDNNSKLIESSCYVYNAIDQLISSSETVSGKSYNFAYDTNGNLLSETSNDAITKTYSYNINNQLVKYADPSSLITQYAYGAEGLRKSKADANGSGSINYYYSSSGSIIGEKDATGSMTSYLARIARSVIPQSGDVVTSYFLSNGKDVVGTTDKSGSTITNKYQYTPYGSDIDLSTNIKR